MKNRFNYQAKGLYFIVMILVAVIFTSLFILLRHPLTGKTLEESMNITVLSYFVASLFILELIIIYFIRDEIKWSKIRTEHDLQGFADLHGQKCKIIAIEKYVNHYQLYFDSKNKRYMAYLIFKDKELSLDEKILLRTNIFYFQKNISEVVIVPSVDIALNPCMSYHKIFFMNEKHGCLCWPKRKKEFI